MAKRNIAMTPLLTHWSYRSLVLSHWCYIGGGDDAFEEMCNWKRIQTTMKNAVSNLVKYRECITPGVLITRLFHQKSNQFILYDEHVTNIYYLYQHALYQKQFLQRVLIKL